MSPWVFARGLGFMMGAQPTERTSMRRFVTSLLASLALAAAVAPAAGAAITTPSNNGHPSTNPAGNCPPGQNQDATPGALNKCV